MDHIRLGKQHPFPGRRRGKEGRGKLKKHTLGWNYTLGFGCYVMGLDVVRGVTRHYKSALGCCIPTLGWAHSAKFCCCKKGVKKHVVNFTALRV